jgi:hypothetical protein
LAASVFLFTSQPVLGSRSQSANPIVHDASAQAPPAQAAAPSMKVHRWSHLPQLLGSKEVFVHAPSQSC